MRGAADGVHVLMYFCGTCSNSHAFAYLCTIPAALICMCSGKAGQDLSPHSRGFGRLNGEESRITYHIMRLACSFG
jgi:hypothetical protein